MANTFDTAGLFLVSTLFDLYLFVLALRLMLVWARADYYNPLSQFVIKLTQWIINPLRKIIPNVKNIELSTVIVFLLFEMIKFYLIFLLTQGMPKPLGVLILSIADGLKTLLNIFFYAILAQAVLSWIHSPYSPIRNMLNQITYPLMRPFQRLIPPIAGMDISPIPVMIVLQLLIIILVTPLLGFGMRLAF